ncbi:MAG TPA: zinc-dependent metalloprotease [Gemmatimonadales bacterium]
MRPPSYGVVLALTLAACGKAAPAAQTPTPARNGGGAAPSAAATAAQQDTGRARPGGTEGPKPYNQVITKEAITDSGVFLVHRIGEKLFYEIPRAQLDKEFLLVVDYAGTPEGTRYGGEELDSRVVRWERMANRVLLRGKSYDIVADSSTTVSRAVRLSTIEPVLMSFDVAAFSPKDSNLVIEVTKLYTTDVPEFNTRRVFRLRRLDPARSLVESARSFPTNIEVRALHTFEGDSVPGNDRGLGTATFEMHYSMVLLPERPMARRLCDNRVGYFAVRQVDYGLDRPVVTTRCYITRWRLEPKDPNAAVSDPIKPIVFYLDPATPERWAPWIIKGVQAWEPVFRAAGFSNAITARRAPTPQEDPEFDLDDARYSTIRWLPSQIENAYGPHTSDPRTGEILQSNIGWFQNITSLLQAWYWVQAGAVDPRARQLPLPDSLMGQMVAYVATHEVGHTLGLPHNQLSSGLYPVDSLRSPTYTRRNGTSYSIMDYARNNYVAQPGDDVQLMPTLGPWDYYVIDWGYRRIPGAATPDAERPLLDSLARLQDASPWLQFGNPDGIDPRTQTEALGDDPVKATRYGLANIKRLVPMLLPATTTDALEDYGLLDDLYDRLIQQWAFEMGHVAVVPGGVWRHEKYPDQRGSIHQPVPRARQAEAVRFLNENAFATPGYFLDTAVLRRIEPTGFVERIRTRQTAVLNTLLQDSRLSRLAEQGATMPAGTAYTLTDLLDDLRSGIFSEVGAARPSVDAYRRNLQQAFVDQMNRLINTPLVTPLPPGFGGFPGFTPPPPRPADARSVARLELRELQTSLGTAAGRAADRTTRAHFLDLQARIGQILNPPR